MAIERTLSIIKPDATRRNLTGKINTKFEDGGLRIVAQVVVQVLEGENAVAKNREIMGATNPEEAAEGTIRKEFAVSIGENSVHGSDSAENAEKEIRFFFSDMEIVG
jgi:nucleoside-diphosphate kinase